MSVCWFFKVKVGILVSVCLSVSVSASYLSLAASRGDDCDVDDD